VWFFEDPLLAPQKENVGRGSRTIILKAAISAGWKMHPEMTIWNQKLVRQAPTIQESYKQWILLIKM
jgi:hypothetical protein